MANLKYAVVVKGIGDATLDTTEDFTKSGFGTPKAAIVFISRNTAHDTPTQHAAVSIGFWNQADDAQACTSCFGEYGADPGDTTTLGYNNKVAAIDDINSALQFSATCDDITDGVRLTFSTTPSANYKATVVLLAGSDLQTKVGMTNLGTGTSPIELSCGFQPNIVLTTVANSSDGTHASNYAYFEFGAAIDTGSGTSHALMWQWQDAATTMKNNIAIYSDRCGAHFAGWSLTISGWDSNGCDVTPSSSTSSWNMGWLALDTGDAGTWLSTFSPPTTASSDWTFSSVGFKPGLVLGGLSLVTSLNTVQTTSPAADTSGVFAFDGTYEGCHLMGDDDGASSCWAYTFSGAKLAYLSSMATTSETNYYDIGHPTMTSSGWSVTDAQVVTADSSTRYWWGLAIEEGATGWSGSGGTCSAASSVSGVSVAFGPVSKVGGTSSAASSVSGVTVTLNSHTVGGGTISAASSVTGVGVSTGVSGGTASAASSVSGVTVALGSYEVAGGTASTLSSVSGVVATLDSHSVGGGTAAVASSVSGVLATLDSQSVAGGTIAAVSSVTGVTVEGEGLTVQGGTASAASSVSGVTVTLASISVEGGTAAVASSVTGPTATLDSLGIDGGTVAAQSSVSGPDVSAGGDILILDLVIQAAIVVVGPSPDEFTIEPSRLHKVSAESRTSAIARETRVHRIGAQERIFSLTVDDVN